jgi:hypothetical protein
LTPLTTPLFWMNGASWALHRQTVRSARCDRDVESTHPFYEAGFVAGAWEWPAATSGSGFGGGAMAQELPAAGEW